MINKNKFIFNTIELHITDHCNLNCAGCFHFAPLAKEHYYDTKQLAKDLLRIRSLTDRSFHVRLLGGEPLLHPQLLDICKFIKQVFPEGKHTIITNGLLLKSKGQEFIDTINELDFTLELSNYTGNPELIEYVNKNFKNPKIYNHLNLTSQYFEFTDKYTDKEIFKNCKIGSAYTIKNGFLYKCNFTAWIPFFTDYFNYKLPDNYNDTDVKLNLYDTEITLNDINKFLNEPCTFCKYCIQYLPGEYRCIPWKKSEKQISEWIR